MKARQEGVLKFILNISKFGDFRTMVMTDCSTLCEQLC